jgi:Transcriptional regulator/sugar kinase
MCKQIFYDGGETGMQKADKETLKNNNKMLILCKLRQGDLSRTELSVSTGLSNSTVSVLVSELVSSNLIFEKRYANSSGGRRQVILSINPEAAYTLLVKIVPGVLEVSFINLELKINNRKKFYFHDGGARESGEEALLSALERGLIWIRQENGRLLDKTAGVGISIPGLVDHSSDIILYSSLLNIRKMDISGLLTARLGKPVYVFKDTDAMAMGEYAINELSNSESYMFILVDSGFGLSFMNKGEILQLNRSGLELGHLRLQENGPRCRCGRSGCVEAFVSESSALRQLELIQEKQGSRQYDISAMRYSDIVEESNRADGICRGVLRCQAGYLGAAIAIGVNIFAPNTVLLAGPLSKAKWEFYPIVREAFAENVLDIFSNTRIEFSTAGEQASLIGMASKIFDTEFFSAETLYDGASGNDRAIKAQFNV